MIEQYKKHEKQLLKDYYTYLKFPSISSNPKHTPDILACAGWLTEYMQKIGMEVSRWETSGHPTLFATHLHAGPDKPTLLIYNHYDVQPVDPVGEWSSPPFEPTADGDKIFARGASDDKGQHLYVLQAIKLLLERDGKLPLNVKMCVEGEEEIGSPGLTAILQKRQEELQADHLAIVDLGLKGPNIPTITLGARGIVTMTVEISGPKSDLHSGSHGGLICNPLHTLVDLLSKLHNENGKVLVPHFYDNVIPLNDEDRQQIAFTFDKEKYQQTFGSPTGGESRYPPLERAWTRPTLEINGINGGYGDEGFKTVIPAKAIAKISCRLVQDQDPQKIGEQVSTFLQEQCPKDMQVKVDVHPGTGKAVRTPPTSPTIQAFAKAYSEILHKPCQFIFEGGSIPIVPKLAQASNAEVVMVGYGLPDDNIHAPNEHFDTKRLQQGCLTFVKAMEEIAKDKGSEGI